MATTDPGTDGNVKRPVSWFKKNARYILAIVLGTVGLVWLLQAPRICGQELGGADKDAPIEVCRAIQLTDPVVLAWVLGIVLVLWGTLSEASIAGVITLKRAVTEAKQATEEARATLLRINASAHQSQQQILSVAPSAPGQFSVNSVHAKAVDLPRPEVVESIQPNPADASVSRETVDLTYVDLVQLGSTRPTAEPGRSRPRGVSRTRLRPGQQWSAFAN
ncbi:MAG: hypothetical protein QM695_04555 [Micropruina sp.]